MSKRKKRFAEPRRIASPKKSDQDILNAFVRADSVWRELEKLPIALLLSDPAQAALTDMLHAAIDLVFRWPVGNNRKLLDALTRELAKRASTLPLEARVSEFVRAMPQINRWAASSLETGVRELGLSALPFPEVVYLWQLAKRSVIEELRRRSNPDRAVEFLRWLFDIGIMLAATLGSQEDRNQMAEISKMLHIAPQERSMSKVSAALDLLIRTTDAQLVRLTAEGRCQPEVNEYERAFTKLQLLRAFWNMYALAVDDELAKVYHRSTRDALMVETSFWVARSAAPIFVSNQFVRMFEDNLGEPMTQPLWDTDVPSPQGFAWLDGSQISISSNANELLVGLLWTKAAGELPNLEATNRVPAVGVVVYPVFEGPRGTLGAGSPAIWLYENTADDSSDVDDKAFHVQVRRLAGSLWSLMSHKLVRVSREHPVAGNATIRPQEQMAPVPEIQVIELRAIEYVKRHAHKKKDESTRKRAAPRYRVMVRRHRINQWFASEGRHKVQWRPLDPDYVIIRGPADAPLKLDAKLLAVVR